MPLPWTYINPSTVSAPGLSPATEYAPAPMPPCNRRSHRRRGPSPPDQPRPAADQDCHRRQACRPESLAELAFSLQIHNFMPILPATMAYPSYPVMGRRRPIPARTARSRYAGHVEFIGRHVLAQVGGIVQRGKVHAAPLRVFQTRLQLGRPLVGPHGDRHPLRERPRLGRAEAGLVGVVAGQELLGRAAGGGKLLRLDPCLATSRGR